MNNEQMAGLNLRRGCANASPRRKLLNVPLTSNGAQARIPRRNDYLHKHLVSRRLGDPCAAQAADASMD